MNATEMQIVITQLRNNYGSLPQPDWTGDATRVWFDELRPYTLTDAMTAVHENRDRAQASLDAGKPVWFPTLIEFTNDLRHAATAAERETYQRDALDAAIRCDGSRWIENAPDAMGNRPFPTRGEGIVACPTCNPSMHKRQLGGNQHEPTPKGEQAAPAPCRPDADEFNGPTLVGRGEIARAKAMLLPTDTRTPAPRVFRSIRELDEPEADTTRQPTDAALRCPWCGGAVSRTKLANWWRCENGEMATMRQILAGSGGGR